MIVDAATLLKAVFTLGLCWALGWTWQLQSSSHPSNSSLKTCVPWTGWCLVALSALQIARMGERIWEWTSLSESDPALSILWQTYSGRLLIFQMVSMWMSFLVWLTLRHSVTANRLIMAGLVFAMGCSAFAGHAASATETFVQSGSGVLHILLAQLWLSGVLGLATAAWLDRSGVVPWRQSLGAFSRAALPIMALTVISGLSIASWSVGSWPALFVTPYGVWLMLKVTVVMAVLWCAWKLRQWLRHTESQLSSGKFWIGCELFFAVTVLCLASMLASAVPAAHESLTWPFPFRWAPVLSWRQHWEITFTGLAGCFFLCVMGILLGRRARQVGNNKIRVTSLFTGISGIVLGLWAIAIEAYPTTYAHSPVRLDVTSVLTGQRLYNMHCNNCHGLHGHGDGPLAEATSVRPANLTEPHVSWHTHGDMFWWLSHGKGQMPGFEKTMTDQDRWHLINWLIALSLGHEARSITSRPAPFNPWLPAIDFRFPMDNDHYFSLSEWRGVHPVHLVIINHPNELQRVRDLLADMKGFTAQLVIVAKPEWLREVVKGPCEAILVSDVEGDIAKAWAMYRRSFASPDFNNEEPWVARTEFLIDRYGFVRARWRSDELPSALSTSYLKTLFDRLNEEGEIRSAAIHQHD